MNDIEEFYYVDFGNIVFLLLFMILLIYMKKYGKYL